MLGTQFGLLVLVSLCTRPYDLSRIGPFYARIHTPVGKENEARSLMPLPDPPESATLGMDGVYLDYRQSSRWAYQGLQRFGLEVPRLSWFDWLGLSRCLGFRGRLDRALDLAGRCRLKIGCFEHLTAAHSLSFRANNSCH